MTRYSFFGNMSIGLLAQTLIQHPIKTKTNWSGFFKKSIDNHEELQILNTFIIIIADISSQIVEMEELYYCSVLNFANMSLSTGVVLRLIQY